MDKKKLAALAAETMKSSYSPYSGFTVGAALLCRSGKVYTGCNIENAAFTPTVLRRTGRILQGYIRGGARFYRYRGGGRKKREHRFGMSARAGSAGR